MKKESLADKREAVAQDFIAFSLYKAGTALQDAESVLDSFQLDTESAAVHQLFHRLVDLQNTLDARFGGATAPKAKRKAKAKGKRK